MSEKLKISIAYILICAIWGSTWLVIRIGLQSIPPYTGIALRFLVASFFIYVIMKIRGVRLQKDIASLRMYGILALFSYAIPFGMVYWAEQYISSGLAAIIFASMPFFVIIFSLISIRNEVVLGAQILGVILGFAGIVVIFSKNLDLNFSADFVGMLALLGSAIIQSAIAVIVKKWGKNLNPLSMNFLPVLVGGLVMLLFALIVEDQSKIIWDSKAFLSVLYLGFFGTVLAFTAYYWLMKRINIVLLSLASFIEPIIAVFLGWLILGEILSFRTIIGSVLVLVGLLFANFSGIKNYLLKKRLEND